jgi:hypothetical protein
MVGLGMISHNRDDVPASRSEQKRITWKIPFDGTNLMQQLLESRRNSSSRKSNYRFRETFLGPRNPVLVSQLMGYLINWRHLY